MASGVNAKKSAVLMRDPNGTMDYQGVKATLLTYQDITELPIAQYLAKLGRFLNTSPQDYYDTAVFVAGTAVVPTLQVKMFTKGQGEPDLIANTGAAIANKSEQLTNMVEGGEFDGGVTFILEQVAVDILLPADKPTTVTNGEIVDPTLTTLANYSASVHMQAVRQQFKLAFYRNEQEIFAGNLSEFPSPFLVSGAFGNDDGFIQNGVGGDLSRKFTHARVLESQDRFSWRLFYTGAVGFTPIIGFNIKVIMLGQVIKPLFA